LIGPNNEGKTNILNALVLAMEALDASRRYPAPVSLPNYALRQTQYEWEQDYPIQLQTSQPSGKTEIILEFELNDHEYALFKKK
jgi:putative ATP-dependent endonuclease of OLD family